MRVKETQFSEAEHLGRAGGGRLEFCKRGRERGVSVRTPVSFHVVLPLPYAGVSVHCKVGAWSSMKEMLQLLTR